MARSTLGPNVRLFISPHHATRRGRIHYILYQACSRLRDIHYYYSDTYFAHANKGKSREISLKGCELYELPAIFYFSPERFPSCFFIYIDCIVSRSDGFYERANDAPFFIGLYCTCDSACSVMRRWRACRRKG